MSGSMISNILRNPASKILIRILLYGITILYAKAGIEVSEDMKVAITNAGDALGMVVSGVVGVIFDIWVHRKDKQANQEAGKKQAELSAT